MEAFKILLIEDEAALATMIQRGLTQEGYEVSAALDGISGLKLASTFQFDLILLDLLLPGISGLELCRAIRIKNSQIPILILTALSTPENIVTGLDTGADDYLVKPFNFDVLNARIRTLIRRNRGAAPHYILKIADLTIDLDAKTVSRQDQPIMLTSTEFRLLEFLATNRQRVLSRIEILEHVWDINFDLGTNVVDVYINYLRKKVDKDYKPKLIHTVFGMGYIMKEPEVL